MCLANPKTGEREVTTARLERDHRLVRSGQAILADKGFAGREFEEFATQYLGIPLVRPDRKNRPGTADSPVSVSGSRPSSTPPKASSARHDTEAEPRRAKTPGDTGGTGDTDESPDQARTKPGYRP